MGGGNEGKERYGRLQQPQQRRESAKSRQLPISFVLLVLPQIRDIGSGLPADWQRTDTVVTSIPTYIAHTVHTVHTEYPYIQATAVDLICHKPLEQWGDGAMGRLPALSAWLGKHPQEPG